MVERYDRFRTDGEIRRVHQEDVCQSLAVPPIRKYENEGGPGVVQTVSLLLEHSRAPEEDVTTFLDSLVLDWIIAGTDGHAKNYSVLISSSGVRLAPLYDIASALPYPSLNPHEVKLAMKIGGKYPVMGVGRGEWVKMATQLRRRPQGFIDRIADLASQVPDEVRRVCATASAGGLSHPILPTLEREISARAVSLAGRLTSGSSAQ